MCYMFRRIASVSALNVEIRIRKLSGCRRPGPEMHAGSLLRGRSAGRTSCVRQSRVEGAGVIRPKSEGP